MPVTAVNTPDGSTLDIEHPEGVSEASILRFARQEFRKKSFEENQTRIREAERETRIRNQGSISRGLDISTDRVAQATGSTLEGIGGLLGLEELERYGSEVALENEADAQRKSRYQQKFDDIEGIGDFGSYLGGIAAESAAPSGASLFGSILGGAAAGTAVAPGIGTAVGAIVGGAAFGLPFFFGMNRERQKEAMEQGLIPSGEVDEGAAFLGGLGQSLLEGIADKVLLGAGRTFKLSDKALRGGGLFTRASKGTAQGTIAESATEFGQAVIERAQAGLSLDNEEAIAEYREAAIAGGLLGGTIGGTVYAARGDVTEEVLPPSGTQLDLFPEELEEARTERETARAQEKGQLGLFDDDELAPGILQERTQSGHRMILLVQIQKEVLWI